MKQSSAMNSGQQRLDQMTVREGATIRDGLQAIDAGASGVCFVCDDVGGLLGLATDGDLRRAILGGAELSNSLLEHVRRDPVVAARSDRRDQIVDLMNARRIASVPVLDDKGKLVQVHTLHELVSPLHLENWAVIMAGGRGARLGQVTASMPKPMVQLAGRPVIERLILNLVGDGIRKIAISINYLGSQIEGYLGEGERFGCEIHWLREAPDLPLGTGGSLSLLARAGIESCEPYLVVNGDVVTQTDFGHLIASHQAAQAAITIGVARHQHEVPFGVVVSTEGVVQSVTEKPTFSWSINSGIYVVSPELVASVPSNESFPITRLIDHALSSDFAVRAVEVNGDWVDIGSASELDAVRDRWEQTNG